MEVFDDDTLSLTACEVREILDLITYDERYEFLVREQRSSQGLDGAGGVTIRNTVGIELAVRRPDAITGEMGVGYGGIRWLSPYASKSDLVRMAFGAILAYNEHEAREFFHYRGRQVFGPHVSVDALHAVAEVTDYRER